MREDERERETEKERANVKERETEYGRDTDSEMERVKEKTLDTEREREYQGERGCQIMRGRLREREDVRRIDTCMSLLMVGLTTQGVRRNGGAEVTTLTKQFPMKQRPTRETPITTTTSNRGFKWKVEGRLDYRKE